jgi:UDP-glucose 4-epimerase
VINVGSGQAVSINGLADQIAQVTGKEISILHNTGQSGGVSRLVADIDLARRVLDWTPTTSLEQGLHLTLERDARFR